MVVYSKPVMPRSPEVATARTLEPVVAAFDGEQLARAWALCGSAGAGVPLLLAVQSESGDGRVVRRPLGGEGGSSGGRTRGSTVARSATRAYPQAMSEHRTLILGGGIAGLEALLAIRDLAGERTELTLIAAEPEFTYKPLIVEEPFTYQPAERHELEPAIRELGGRFVPGAARAVHPDRHAVVLHEGYEGRYVRELSYDLLVVCVGGRSPAADDPAVSFRLPPLRHPLEVDDLLARAEAHDSRTLAFVVPPGVTWTLPLYELALLTRRRAEESARRDLSITLLTPEEA